METRENANDEMNLELKADVIKITSLELISSLARYARSEIPPELLNAVTPREYSTSRVWRARDLPDMLIRASLDWYYRFLEFPILKRRLAA